jgi:hypothetical protein
MTVIPLPRPSKCPDCGGLIQLDDGRLVCGFTRNGVDWSCGWTGPALIDDEDLDDP